ncbi:hypothetical protein ABZ656_48410 [Streptomyces sp. NPDC007095]|uniref:hypothetical protein n=1 Tax=Streptomyces sp. NPDC007095 TaxID=3154482 RepID=UPI0033F79923
MLRWDLKNLHGTSRPPCPPDLGHGQGRVTAMEFSADGSRLATGDDRGDDWPRGTPPTRDLST